MGMAVETATIRGNGAKALRIGAIAFIILQCPSAIERGWAEVAGIGGDGIAS